MLYLFDTDHSSLIARQNADGSRIKAHVALVPLNQIAFNIVSYEEHVRGWLAEIARARSISQQKIYYEELNKMLDLYCATPILPFDDAAISIFQNLWLQRIRVGTMDLKIASIALANNAILLTRNYSNFSKVPNLKLEDWTLE